LKKALINSPLKPVIAWMTRKMVKFNPITHKSKVSEGGELLGLET
jgi:hypothetical protein